MDFSLSTDQQMLRDSVQRYLDKEYTYDKRRRVLREGGFSARIWSDFARFGWLGAALPEDAGGFGGGPEEAAVLAECFGRRAVLEPYLWTVVVGGALLREGLAEPTRSELLAAMVEGGLQLGFAVSEEDAGQDFLQISTRAEPAADGWTLRGRKPVVPNGGIADRFFVSARGPAPDDGVSVFLVGREAAGLTLRNYRGNDGQPLAELTLDGVRVTQSDLVGRWGHGRALLSLACDHGAAALCADIVGSSAYLLETTCEYLKTRQQYGAPLAKLQVLQHRVADMYVAVEMARSMAAVAAAALALRPPQREHAVSAARIQAIQCARLVGREAVQLHGGMGMSEELDVSAHFKRLAMACLLFGDEDFHLSRFAEAADA